MILVLKSVPFSSDPTFDLTPLSPLSDVENGFLLDKAFLIMDRDTTFSKEFRSYLDQQGVKSVRCPVRAPNCNAFAERFVRSIREEYSGRMILFGEKSLRRILREYIGHYQTERNHQGVENQLLEQVENVRSLTRHVHRHQRPGDLVKHFMTTQLSGFLHFC